MWEEVQDLIKKFKRDGFYLKLLFNQKKKNP